MLHKDGDMTKKKKEQISDQELLIAYKIRAARRSIFASAAEAAKAHGILPSQWSQWETARMTPHTSSLQKLAKLFADTSSSPFDLSYFHERPDNWEVIRNEFINEIEAKARIKRTYPSSFGQPPDSSQTQNRSKSERKSESLNDEIGETIYEIYERIANERKKVDQGVMATETYDEHMKLLIGMITVSLFNKHSTVTPTITNGSDSSPKTE